MQRTLPLLQLGGSLVQPWQKKALHGKASSCLSPSCKKKAIPPCRRVDKLKCTRNTFSRSSPKEKQTQPKRFFHDLLLRSLPDDLVDTLALVQRAVRFQTFSVLLTLLLGVPKRVAAVVMATNEHVTIAMPCRRTEVLLEKKQRREKCQSELPTQKKLNAKSSLSSLSAKEEESG